MMNSIRCVCIVLIFFALGCDADNFLNISPKTSVTEGNFYNNEEEIQQAVDDVYRQLGANIVSAQSVADIYGELYSDNTYIVIPLAGDPVDEQISRHEIRASNARVFNAWRDSYSTIYTINNVIEVLENTEVEIDENLKNRWISEITVIRSLAYFNLVRAFGDIPLILEKITTEEAYDYLREDTETVYNQLIDDLNTAKGILPEEYVEPNVGRVTKFGAAALLAKIYLTIGDEAGARSELEFIINSDQFSLDANNDGIVDVDDYEHLFDPETKNSRSSVLEAQYQAGIDAANSNHQFTYMPFHWEFNLPGVEDEPFRGAGANSPSHNLASEFEEGDPRKEVSIRPGYTNQSTGEFVEYPHTLKFFDPNWENAGQNFEIIRYADILLMYAEVTGDEEYLNMVRERVGLPPFGSEAYPSDEYPTLSLAIEHERRMELCFEMHRMFDLVRTERVEEVMSEYDRAPGFRSDRILFPIPERSIDVNPDLEQNSGY